MSFFRGLLMARSHLAFLMGLGLALTVVWTVNRYTGREQPRGRTAARSLGAALELPEEVFPPREPGAPLTEEERRWAQAAWSYFVNNTQAQTGLANSVDGFTSTTLWDTGSYLMGVLSAEALGVIPPEEAQQRLERALESLAKLPLCDGKLPNKAYDTRTLAMVDYANTPITECLGWSAIDVARIGVPFSVLVWRRPALTPRVERVLSSWQLGAVTASGELQGSSRTKDGQLVLVQEGRLGYEQYAARSLLLLGLDVGSALDVDAHLSISKVSGQLVPHDDRMPEQHDGTHNAVLSEPYLLEGAEFGFDAKTRPIARAVLRAQARRFEQTGKLTAVSEDHLDRAPFFVYSSVLSGGKPWAVFTPDGKPAEEHRTLSTKAALGWGVLFGGAYPDRLLAEVGALVEPGKGVYAGRYEASGAVNRALTANTNGIVLELLAYRVHGPWLRAARIAKKEGA